MHKTYLYVEVGHLGNTRRIQLSAVDGGTDVQLVTSAVVGKVHERTGDVELLVDDLRGAQRRGVFKPKPKAVGCSYDADRQKICHRESQRRKKRGRESNEWITAHAAETGSEKSRQPT